MLCYIKINSANQIFVKGDTYLKKLRPLDALPTVILFFWFIQNSTVESVLLSKPSRCHVK